MKKILSLVLVSAALSGCASSVQSVGDSGRDVSLRNARQQGTAFTVAKDQVVTFKAPTFDNAGDFGVMTPENGGYTDELWSGVDTRLGSQLPIIPPVKAGHDNFKSMLLTSAKAPGGFGADWLRARIQTLLLMNEKEAATKLSYESLRGRDLDAAEEVQLIQLLFWTHKKESACLEALGNRTPDTNLQTIRSLCYAMIGQRAKAQQSWEDMKATVTDETLGAYVDALLNKEPLPEFPENHPLRTVLAVAGNEIAGHGRAVPAPLFVDDAFAMQAQKRERKDDDLDAAAVIAQFDDAANQNQKGRIVLLTYYVSETAEQSGEEIDPVVIEAAVSAWQKSGWTAEAGRLRSELAAIKPQS